MAMSQLDSAQVIKSVYDAVTNALNVNITGGSITTSVESDSVDDAPFVQGTDTVSVQGAIFDDTSPDSINEGDAGAVRMSSNRNLYTQIRDAAGNERGANVSATNALKVDGSAVTQPISATALTDASQKTQIVDGSGNVISSTANALNVNIASGVTLEVNLDNANDDVLVYGFDGAANQKIKTDAAGELQIDVLSSALPTGAATSANQATEIASLASIDGKVPANLTVTSTRLLVDGSGVTQPVSATNLDIRDLTSASDSIASVQSGAWNVTNITGTVSLPTGASTLAEQQTQTTSLQLLDDTVTTTGSAITTKGLAISGTDGTNARVLKTDSNGELQVDVLTMPTTTVTATDLDIRDLTSVSDSVSSVQSGTWNITNISGTVSLPTGAATLAEQQTQTTSLQLLDDTVATTGAAITTKGFAFIGTDGTNARVIKTDAGGELQVDVLSMPTVTVTATNLDIRDLTSVSDSVSAVQSGTWNVTNISGTISLPTGAATLAEQQTQSASLSIMDDWDESDRAKVNTIVGQAGVQGGSGVVSTNTQRVVLATDVALPAGTNNIGDVDVLTQPARSHTTDSIKVGDGTDFLLITAAGEANTVINNASGASAVNIQDGGNSITVDGTVASTQSGTWNVTNITGTVSLPTGAATSANQTNKTQYTHITDGTDDALVTAAGELNVLESNSSSISSSVSSIDTKTPALGQALAAASIPVVLTAAQLTTLTPVTSVTVNNAAGASAVNIQDGGNSLTVDGTVAATQSGTWNINNITGTVSLPTGAATEATLSLMNARMAGSLTPHAYDYISLAYTGENLTTVIFKTGGAGGTIVDTLTLAYSGSVLTSVTRT